MSYQSITILGNLGKDPEQRFFPNGDEISSFSVAVSESWKSKEGEKKEKTTWFNCQATGGLAKVCNTYLTKGSTVLLAGKMECRDYEKDGVKRQAWDLRIDQMKMVGGKKDGEQSSGSIASKPAQNQSRSSQGAGPVNDGFEDDIPFVRISNKRAMAV